MKNKAQARAIIPVVLGLFGMSGYEIMLHLKHPVILERDLVHGLWLGVCIGLMMLGIFVIGKNRS